MGSKYKSKEWDEKVIEASKEPTAFRAAAKLGVRYSTYRDHAKRLGVFKTNQSGKGLQKPKAPSYITEDILAGKHPHVQTVNVKRRLLKEGYKKNKCEVCGTDSWNGKPIICELNHIDGNCRNHKLNNLQMLCPNCHSQTETFRGRNKD